MRSIVCVYPAQGPLLIDRQPHQAKHVEKGGGNRRRIRGPEDRVWGGRETLPISPMGRIEALETQRDERDGQVESILAPQRCLDTV